MDEFYKDYDEKEVNFTFKQLRKVALGDEISQYNFTKGDKLSLLCCSKYYGLVFISKSSGFIVFPSDTLLKCHETNFSQPLNQVIPAQYSGIQSRHIELGFAPFLLSLNADNSILICFFRNPQNLITAAFFDVTNFAAEIPTCQPNAVLPLTKDPNVLLIDFQWNPTKQDMFALCFSNGECLSYLFSFPQNLHSFPPLNNKTTSICWSPKGKHLAIGTNEGNLEQYSCEKDIFQFVKKHPQISNLASLQTKVVHLKWVSTYLFAIVYSLLTDSGETDQILVLKHTKKTEKTIIINFSDVYVQSDNSPTFYFSELFSQQGILITTTGLANEVFVLANQTDLQNACEWFLAVLDDTSRAEIPLEGVEETFPMGLAIDTTSITPIPTDKEPLPPCPILLLLTTKGVLCPFHIIYENMHGLIEPAKPLKSSKQPSFNPAQLIKAQTGNPQDVPKNPSTTTVTVVGGSKPITAKSPTFVLTQEHPAPTGQEQALVGPFTEPMPAKTLGATPAISTASIPPGQESIFKIPAAPSAAPGIFGAPSAPQQSIFTLPKIDEQTQKNPPSTLQIPNNPMGAAKPSTQPAIFNISPDQNTLVKSDQVPKHTTNMPQSQPTYKPAPPDTAVNNPPQTQSKIETTPILSKRTLSQVAPVSVTTNTIDLKTTPKTPQTQNQPPPIGQPANPNPTNLPKTVSFEPQRQVTSTVPAPKIAISPQIAQLSHSQAKPMQMPSPIVSSSSPTKTVSAQAQPTKPTISLSIPVTSPKEIEVRYETHIRNEIEEFSDDLDQLKTKLRAKFGDFDDAFQGKLKDLVGSVEEKNKMYRDTSKVRIELNALITAFDEMNQIISTIRNEGFHIQEKIEDANKAKKWISSAKFGFFIATTPLDPISEQKKKALIQTYSILDQKLQEVETMILTLLNKSSDINDLQAIFKTISSQEQIVQNLYSKMEKLSGDIDEFKFEKQLSKINISTTCINPYELLTKSLEKQHFDFKVKSNRIVELKDYLCHIPTAQIIKPRNPTNRLNISRSINSTREKIVPKPKLPENDPQKTVLNQLNSSLPPNTGFKLIVSPHGELYVSPIPHSLPEGCISFDASQLNLFSQNAHATTGNKQSPTRDMVPERLGQNNDEYTRESKPKVMIEHKPQSGSTTSPPKSSQTGGPDLDNLPRDQRVNRTLDFSTPPKHLAGNSDSVTSTPMRPFEDSPQDIAPNVNLFPDSIPRFGPGPLESLPDYSFGGGPMHPLILPSPGKAPSTTFGHSPKQVEQPQIPSNDPRLKQMPQSESKPSQDTTLYNLLSTHDVPIPNAQTQPSGRDKPKGINLLNPLPKPPSTLLQSTNPEKISSPSKTSDIHKVKSTADSTRPNLGENPQTIEKSISQPSETMPESKSGSDLIGQTLNIPNPSNLPSKKTELPSTSVSSSQTDNAATTPANQTKLPTGQLKPPSDKPDTHTVPSGHIKVPSGQIIAPAGQSNATTPQANQPTGQTTTPSSQMPSFQLKLPHPQGNSPFQQATQPNQHPTLALGQNNSQIGSQPGKENPKPVVTMDADSEMQDDTTDEIIQGASFGLGASSSTQAMGNNPNPFGFSGGPNSGTAGLSNPFSGGAPPGTTGFNINPPNQATGPSQQMPPSIFGVNAPNFGGGASLFQSSLFQGISPQKPDVGFGRNTGGATFGSIASKPQQPAPFGQTGNPMAHPSLQQPQGQNLLGNMSAMSGQGGELKGKSFMTYRS